VWRYLIVSTSRGTEQRNNAFNILIEIINNNAGEGSGKQKKKGYLSYEVTFKCKVELNLNELSFGCVAFVQQHIKGKY